jgi:translation initiation factor IF-1
MVKNVTGGCKSKKMANKHVNAPKTDKLRLALEDGEIYAIVTKNFGNGVQVQTIKNETLFCHIRGRFTGRSRRDNTLTIGSWVLVGMREWESTKKNCDLLEVYSSQEVERLRKSVYENWSILIAADPTGAISGVAGGGDGRGAVTAAAAAADDIDFSDCIEEEIILPPQKLPKNGDLPQIENDEHVLFEGGIVSIDDI